MWENNAKQRKTTQNVFKMKKDTKTKKLPNSFRRSIIFDLLMLKKYPAKNLFRRSNSDKIATVLIMKFSAFYRLSAFLTLAHNCIAPNSSIDAP